MTAQAARPAEEGSPGAGRPVLRLRRPVVASVRLDRRVLAVVAALVLAVLVVLVGHLALGEFPISPLGVLETLVGRGDRADSYVVLGLRLPRALTAILAGAALALSGHLFQTLVRNPLASPDIIGITAGASVCAVAVLVLGLGAALVPLGALVGGTVASALIYVLAWRGGASPYRFVLVGIGIAAAGTAATSYLLVVGDITDVAQAVVWLVGSLNGRTWPEVVAVGVPMLVLLPAAVALARSLDAVALGEETARVLGVGVERVRLGVVATATAMASVAVAATGPIGFVAFLAPHIARGLAHRAGAVVLPVAALTGALLVLVADLVAQALPTRTALPVGVLTAVLGAPYFMVLLRRVTARGA